MDKKPSKKQIILILQSVAWLWQIQARIVQSHLNTKLMPSKSHKTKTVEHY